MSTPDVELAGELWTDDERMDIRFMDQWFTVWGLFGLMSFIYLGVWALIYAYARHTDMSLAELSEPKLWPLAVTLGIVGVLLVIGRTQLVIDRKERTVTRHWGLGLPGLARLSSNTWTLDDFKRVSVRISKQFHLHTRGTRYTRSAYPVVLEGPGGEVRIFKSSRHDVARDKAMEVAAFAQFGLDDATGLGYSGAELVLTNEAAASVAAREQASPAGLEPVAVSDLWGYADAGGAMVIPPLFNAAEGFAEGLAAVEIAGKWGYIDVNGQSVIKPQFDEASPFCDGVATVRLAGESRLQTIDKEGAFVSTTGVGVS